MFLFVDIITLFTRVLLRHLGGVIFGFYYYSVLPFVLFVTKKRGVIFYLDRDCIFNRSSDFCPIMAKVRVC
jgi:hypothetical protein